MAVGLLVGAVEPLWALWNDVTENVSTVISALPRLIPVCSEKSIILASVQLPWKLPSFKDLKIL